MVFSYAGGKMKILQTAVLMLVLGYLIAASEDQGSCQYRFQVWQADENVLSRIKDLEYKCDDITHKVERRVDSIKDEISQEMRATRNMTVQMEKVALEQKLDNIQVRLDMKDVKLQLAEVKNDHERMNNRLTHPMDVYTGHRNRRRGNLDYKQLRIDLEDLNRKLTQVASGITDLRAEWLLIKREVNELTSATTQAGYNQNDLKEQTVKLKTMITNIQKDTQTLKDQQTDLKTINTKLRKTVVDLRNENVRIRDGQADVRVKGLRFNDSLHEIKSQNNRLEMELDKLKEESEQTTRDVMAVALRLTNMTQSEMEELVQNLPTRLQPKAFLRDNNGDQKPEARNKLPRDCHEIYQNGYRTSGVYLVQPSGASIADNMYCEMVNNTGWTLIQRRIDGSVSFNRRWMEYKFGFGNPYGEFWLGNEILHYLTSQDQYNMRVDLWDWEGRRYFAEYDKFRVDNIVERYKLHIGGFRGNAGNAMSNNEDNYFSTEDSDNDRSTRNCAGDHKGGWWYNACGYVNLNGMYRTGWYQQAGQGYADGIVWYTLRESDIYSVRKVEMKVAPRFRN